jgi:phosphate:Na+ symporter
MLLHIIGDFERISDHCSNIAGCVIKMEHTELDIHKYLKSIKTGENAEFMADYEAYKAQYSL